MNDYFPALSILIAPMTRVSPRTNFHSSALVRCLADFGIMDAVEPGNTFAEKLGLWIHFTDAIALSSVHSGSIAGTLKVPSAAHVSTLESAISSEFARTRTNLINSITKSCMPNSRNAHIALPMMELELPLNIAAAYVPYRRFYEAHQRDMELSIQPVRTNVREAIAKASPKLRKLAELDAAFETILRERESKLLSKIPVLLNKRFVQLFNEHQQKRADIQQADRPAHWMQAGGWLAQFCNDMQTLLLAEAELRLQPTLGLIEAFNAETKQAT